MDSQRFVLSWWHEKLLAQVLEPREVSNDEGWFTLGAVRLLWLWATFEVLVG